jgi:hypothetical protein
MVLTEERVEAMIVEALDGALEATAADVVDMVRHQLVGVIDNRLNHFRATLPQPNGRGPREFQNSDFTDCKPSEFRGGVDPIASRSWLTEVEGAFLTSGFPENKKVTLARTLLKEVAGDWWGVRTSGMTAVQVAAITWNTFVEWFISEFVPRVVVEHISTEFQNLKQTTESLTVMYKKFIEMARFCPLYAANDEMN